MRIRLSLAILIAGLTGACSAPSGPYPSLAPRPAESIDPRVPIEGEVQAGPASSTLSAQLKALVDQAEAGDAGFAAAAANAERLARAAGSPQSEGWVAAQQALSTVHAARATTARSLGDIDGIAAAALERTGGIAPGDLAAIQAAAGRVQEIDRRQLARIAAIEARLGI